MQGGARPDGWPLSGRATQGRCRGDCIADDATLVASAGRRSDSRHKKALCGLANRGIEVADDEGFWSADCECSARPARSIAWRAAVVVPDPRRLSGLAMTRTTDGVACEPWLRPRVIGADVRPKLERGAVAGALGRVARCPLWGVNGNALASSRKGWLATAIGRMNGELVRRQRLWARARYIRC